MGSLGFGRWGLLGTEGVDQPRHQGNDQAGPKGKLEKVKDVEEAELGWVAQPVKEPQ